MNLVVFDFCETLVNFQTANAFVNFVAERKKTWWSRFISKLEIVLMQSRFFAIVDRFFSKYNFSKRVNLMKIRGYKELDILNYANDYYNTIIRDNTLKLIVSELEKYVNQGDYVMIASGGYDVYLNKFAKDFGIKQVISTNIEFKKGKVSGFYVDGKDCLFDEKVIQLNQFLNKNDLKFDKKIVFTDSITDLPLLMWANEAYVVSNRTTQTWPGKYNFKEIVL